MKRGARFRIDVETLKERLGLPGEIIAIRYDPFMEWAYFVLQGNDLPETVCGQEPESFIYERWVEQGEK